MELQLTADQNEWRAEVRDFLDTELPARWEKSTEWCEDEDFWAFATAFTRKVSARGWELDIGDERYHRERIADALAA
jgi:hypothetical protein